jgi:2-polyprenyl-6-methoxyphenol hydroxylase-like FAD-dependent oxidoreductase
MNLIMSPRRYTLFTAAFDHRPAAVDVLTSIRTRAQASGLDPDLLFDATSDYILWGFITPADEYPADSARRDGPALQHLVSQRIARWHPDLRRLITASDPSSVALNPFKTAVPIPPWESTNVTLLGDAMHNMPPVGGLGGNLALRDASRLARALVAVQQGESPLLPAIHAYETELRAYGFAAVRDALEHTRQAISGNHLGRMAARTWFRACHALPPLKRVFEDQWTQPMRN